MRTLLLACVVILVPGCGPRSLWTRLEHPSEYEAVQQAEAEYAAVVEAREAVRRQPGEVQPALGFAKRLAAASVRAGALDVLTEAGDAIDRQALLASAVEGLQTAATAHPEQAEVLHLSRAELLLAVEQPVPAAAALQDSLQARPTFAALRMLNDLPGPGQPTPEQLKPACDTLHGQLVLPEDVVGDQQRQEAVVFDVVTFLERCGGITRVVLDGDGTQYEFADWVSARERQSYLRVRRAVSEVHAQDRARTEARLRESCIDRCEREYKACTSPDVGCERERRSCIQGC